jgi:hypothetical protein
LKLAPLLAEFLYTHKKLQLAGIGIFLFDGIIDPLDETSRNGKNNSPAGISFESNSSLTEDSELISFISKQTGKMKALASSDLQSYMESVKEFLNVGNPFQIEGIGTLVKIKHGQFIFTPGSMFADKLSAPGMKELAVTSSTEDTFTGYEKSKSQIFNSTFIISKLIVVVLFVAGIGIAIGGGYTVYKRNEARILSQQIEPETVPDTNTIQLTSPITEQVAISSIPQGSYKFIYETTDNKERALKRYQIVYKLNSNIQLETKDSVIFKIYTILPATPKDTSRIKENLHAWYYGTNGMKITIEQ